MQLLRRFLTLCLLATFYDVPTSAATLTLADQRFEASIYASNPQIVTPIGLAIGDDHSLFVVESHTHQPKSNYPGPRSDRIKRFKDTNADGQPDEMEVFADGYSF